MSLREEILAAPDLQKVIISVPEWGGVSIEARELSGLARQRFFALVRPGDGEQVNILRYHAAAFVMGAYEPGGGPIFDQGDSAIEAEILEVSQKNPGVFYPIAVQILELSGIGKKAEADTEKNSGGDAPNA
jgi:hypothetical protein